MRKMNWKKRIGSVFLTLVLIFGIVFCCVPSVNAADKTVTFRDFGMADGDAGYGCYQAPFTSWDNVTLKGSVTLAEGGIMTLGHDGSEEWVGIQINPSEKSLLLCTFMVGADGNIHQFKMDQGKDEVVISAEEANVKSFFKAIDISISFSYEGNNVVAKIAINDKAVKTITVGQSFDSADWAKDCIGNYLFFSGGIVKSTEDASVKPPVFSEITFSSFGVEDGTYGYNGVDLAVTGSSESGYVNKSFAGTVKFSSQKSSMLNLAGKDSAWEGVRLVTTGDNQLYFAEAYERFVAIPIDLDIVPMDTDVDIKLSFEVTDLDEDGKKDDVRFWLYVNDVLYRGAPIAKIADYAQYLGNYFGIYSDSEQSSVTVKSKVIPGAGEEESPEEPLPQKTPEELGFKEITLNSFGLENNDTYAVEDPSGYWRFDTYIRTGISSLDMTCLNTRVQFAKDTDARINYVSADGWHGIAIFAQNDKLYLTDAEDGEGKGFSLKELGLKSLYEPFDLKLGIRLGSFGIGTDINGNQESQCDEVLVSMWINDKLVVQDLAFQNIILAGNGIGMYLTSGSITLGTPEGAYTGADFSLVGFTKNWEKELGIK